MPRDATLRAAPRHEEFTIARAGRRAKPGLWLFPVFVLFRPVIDGRSPRSERRRRRGFLVLIPPLTGNEKRRVVAGPPVFLLLFTGKYRAAGVAVAGCRSRRGSLPHAVSAGARLRD